MPYADVVELSGDTLQAEKIRENEKNNSLGGEHYYVLQRNAFLLNSVVEKVTRSMDVIPLIIPQKTQLCEVIL